ncbi:MAG TPA: GerMN domain-containing protein [Firmicutes bacterium]|nr:GerMN domain-containing protein [Bacillota bacterium]
MQKSSKISLLILVLLFGAVILGGCGSSFTVPQEGEEKDGTITENDRGNFSVNAAGAGKEQALLLYYQEPEGEYLVPITVTRSETANPERAIVSLLAQDLPSGSWIVSPFPRGVYVEDLEIREGIAAIKLMVDSSFTGFERGSAELLAKSLVFSLSSLPEINMVEITADIVWPVDSMLQEFPAGLKNPRELILNPLEKMRSGDKGALLWFGGTDAMYMVPVTRKIDGLPEQPEEAAEFLLGELKRGPGDAYPLLASFSPETTVLGVKVKDGLAEVNFNDAFAEQQTVCSEWVAINSIVLTLTELPEIDRVQILIEGRIVDAVPGQIDTSAPLKRGNVNWLTR